MVSDLESDMMNVLWKERKATARAIYGIVKKDHKVVYSTIAVTLDRLHEKGWVEREIETCRGGLRYIYIPKMSQDEVSRKLSDKFLEFLKKSFGESSAAYLRKKLASK